ncbi:MAG: hypothetical protein AAGF20_00025 [Pseudomonadota bacterium]
MPAKPSNSRKFPKQTSGPRPGQFKKRSSPQMRAGSASGVKAYEIPAWLGAPLHKLGAWFSDRDNRRLLYLLTLAAVALHAPNWIDRKQTHLIEARCQDDIYAVHVIERWACKDPENCSDRELGFTEDMRMALSLGMEHCTDLEPRPTPYSFVVDVLTRSQEVSEAMQVKLEAPEPENIGTSLKPDHLKVADANT